MGEQESSDQTVLRMGAQDTFEQPLFRAAEEQVKAGHYFLAVVIAQVAIEAVAEISFFTRFAVNLPRSANTMRGLLPDRSFQQRATRRVWTDLTGDEVTADKSLWKPYLSHVERRNQAAHGSVSGLSGSEPISEDDARQSIDACRAMTKHIHSVLANVFDSLFADGRRAAELDDWRAIRVVTPRPATEASAAMAPVWVSAREDAGMTVEDLARKAGIHVESLRRLENGALEPTLTVLRKIAVAVSVDVPELVRRAGSTAT